MHKNQKRSAALTAASIIASLLPSFASAQEADFAGRTEPFEQQFAITAYYSPLANQCCYVKGGERADKILNGEGFAGADGTPVYPGMLAAPGIYPFGTRIVLPGLGVMTVHDRGGAIIANGDVHRLDIWAGHGEEGLARALAFGFPKMKGTVYLPGMKLPEESFSFDAMPVDLDRLEPFYVEESGLLAMRPEKGQKGLSVTMLQKELQHVGYFDRSPTGMFGDETQSALRAFLNDFGLHEPDDKLTETTAAYLLAAGRLTEAELPLSNIGPESAESDVKSAQRLLRYVGLYKGRTNGLYDDKLFTSILEFQKQQLLAADTNSPGAGRIGPMTKGKLTVAWKKKRVALIAGRYLDREHLRVLLEKNGERFARYFSEGDGGGDVTELQRFLADKGYFPAEKINGHFGPQTKEAVTAFQIALGVVKSAADSGAGTVGPSTLRSLRAQQFGDLYRVVRAQGFGAL